MVIDALDLAYGSSTAEEKSQHVNIAKTCIQKAESIKREDSEFWVAKSLLLMLDGQWNSVRGLLTARLELFPNDIPAMMAKAYLEFYEQKYLESLKLYQNVLRSNPSCPPTVRLGIGLCAYNLGYMDVAIAAFRRVLELVCGWFLFPKTALPCYK